MQEKLIELEGKETRILIQWGEGRVVIKSSAKAIALYADALDQLITGLLRARSHLRGQGKTILYARVPPDLKIQLVAKADEEGLTQNAAILQAVKKWIRFS